MLSKALCAILKTFIYIRPLLPPLSPTLLLTGLVVWIPVVLFQVTMSFLVITSSHGPPKSKPLRPVLTPKLNIVVLSMLFLNLVGYTTFSLSSIVLFRKLPWFIVIMLILYIFWVIIFNTKHIKMNINLLVKRLHVDKFVFLMSRLDIRLQICL